MNLREIEAAGSKGFRPEHASLEEQVAESVVPKREQWRVGFFSRDAREFIERSVKLSHAKHLWEWDAYQEGSWGAVRGLRWSDCLPAAYMQLAEGHCIFVVAGRLMSQLESVLVAMFREEGELSEIYAVESHEPVFRFSKETPRILEEVLIQEKADWPVVLLVGEIVKACNRSPRPPQQFSGTPRARLVHSYATEGYFLCEAVVEC